MGLFGANYAKEGPGVDKNAPEKKRFFTFFDIFFRKFWKLIQLNLLYVLFFVPGIAGAYYWLMGGFNILSLLLVLVSVVLMGPATAGMTYVLRNFAREEHAFIFSDFKDNFKSNFKQASIYGTAYTLVNVVILIAAWFYYRNAGQNTFMYVPLVLCLASLIVLLFMNFYMYTMIVTFRLTIRQMLKNAFIFSVIGVFTNLLTLLIVGVITVLMVLFFPITVLFLATITFSLCWFIISFNVYPRIKKHMIDPYVQENNSEDALDDTDEPIFSDERLIPPSGDDDDR